MTAPSSIELVLQSTGGLERRLPALAFAAAFHLRPADVTRAFEILLLGPDQAPRATDHAAPEEGTIGEVERFDRFVSIESIGSNDPEEKIESKRFDRSAGAREGAAPTGVATFAQVLAQALGDTDNLGAITKLAAMYPRTLLDAALTRTLAVPRERLRVNRAAYFTAVLRTLAACRTPRPPPV